MEFQSRFLIFAALRTLLVLRDYADHGLDGSINGILIISVSIACVMVAVYDIDGEPGRPKVLAWRAFSHRALYR